MRDVIPCIFAIQHRMNPLHVYCRFMERGYRHGTTVFYCKVYEITVFSWMRRVLRYALVVACACSSTREEPLPSRLGQTSRRTGNP
ncbi:MAG: hypothetical protein K9M82_00665 [Deltaproteobacteria bacterium]|nr:hypothetical protein [Deltaproteobacteria bacterium]